MSTLVINLYGSSGAGKSTLAAEVFVALKRRGYSVELVREYVKELVWKGVMPVAVGQAFIMTKQLMREVDLLGKVDIIVTDSPWRLAVFYGVKYDGMPESASLELGEQCLENREPRQDINFFVKRTKPYDQRGRIGSEKTSDKESVEIREFLERNGVELIDTHSLGMQDILEAVLSIFDANGPHLGE